MLRFVFCTLLAAFAASASADPLPPELDHALQNFRAEGAPHWAFTQTTVAEGKTLVERFDPSQREFSRWTLLQENGAAPSPSTLRDYRDRLSRRTSGYAPNLKEQLDFSTCERISEDADRALFRFRLKPGDKSDRSASHMNACFTLHKATGAIERVELASFESFSPMFAVRIAEAKTVLTYSLPSQERPSLLQSVTVHMRGRVMLFKSLDADMTVSYSDYAFAAPTRKAAPAASENPARTVSAQP